MAMSAPDFFGQRAMAPAHCNGGTRAGAAGPRLACAALVNPQPRVVGRHDPGGPCLVEHGEVVPAVAGIVEAAVAEGFTLVDLSAVEWSGFAALLLFVYGFILFTTYLSFTNSKILPSFDLVREIPEEIRNSGGSGADDAAPPEPASSTTKIPG